MKQRIWMNPASDCAELRGLVKRFHPDAQIMGKAPRRAIKSSPIPRPCVELTEIGEQYVIPGCERHEKPAGAQLKLWESTK